MRIYRYIFLIFLSIILVSCISIKNPPEPSGSSNVGTQSFEFIDTNRLEWFTDNPDDLRRIMIQVWYPTNANQGKKESYIDYGNIRIKGLANQFSYPPFLFKNLVKIKTNSFSYSEPDDKDAPYPLIIFSHGLGGNRTQNTIMIEELASHGYVVIAIEHAYDANISIFNNGDIADYRSGINYERKDEGKDLTPEEFWSIRLPQLETRVADVNFVINQIENNQLPTNIQNIIDLNNIGILGHSFGGATSIYSSYLDDRIDACLNLDGWMVVVPDKIISDGIQQDFMYIGQDKWWDELNYNKLDQFIKSNSSSSKILIPGTTHYDFSDMPHLASVGKILGKSGKIDMGNLKDALNILVLSFFDKNLKDVSSNINYYDFAVQYGLNMRVEKYLYE